MSGDKRLSKGWKVKKLGGCEIQRGLTYSGKDAVDYSKNIVRDLCITQSKNHQSNIDLCITQPKTPIKHPKYLGKTPNKIHLQILLLLNINLYQN
jgi:hypothetical protein